MELNLGILIQSKIFDSTFPNHHFNPKVHQKRRHEFSLAAAVVVVAVVVVAVVLYTLLLLCTVVILDCCCSRLMLFTKRDFSTGQWISGVGILSCL